MKLYKRYLKEPFQNYSDRDLLILMIGGSRAAQVADALLKHYTSLKYIAQLDALSLARFPGVGTITATKIHAGLLAGRRALFPLEEENFIHTPQSAYELLWPFLIERDHEELWVIYLSRSKKVLLYTPITLGNDRFTIVDAKQIFAKALSLNAAGIIIAHNHPSGDPTPSSQDIMVTQKVKAAGELLNTPLIDHIILGRHSFSSFAELNLLETPS